MVVGPPVGGNERGVGKSLNQTLPDPPGEISPHTSLSSPTSITGEDGVVLLLGTSCIWLTEG